MKNKKSIIITICLTIVSIVYTILVKNFDVRAIGPKASEVGFSRINEAFRNAIGNNMNIYKVSDILGYLIFVIAFIYTLIGLVQLIKRKKITKVDRELILLAIFYVLVLLTYIFFEKVIINYRPVLIDGILEASYPSSHTMLAISIGLSSLLISKKYINKDYVNSFNLVTVSLCFLVLLLRTISGVHYLSDIVGGVLIALTLVMSFKTALDYKK